MKKIKRKNSAVIAEYLRHIAYSLSVLLCGLFIPASLIFGITYDRPVSKEETKISMYQKDNTIINQTINLSLQHLSDKSS
jgi:hypothetical protein